MRRKANAGNRPSVVEPGEGTKMGATILYGNWSGEAIKCVRLFG